MNEPPSSSPNPAGPPPDWDSIFHRARRQILGRVLLVGAVAALGALFLLGGGLSAQGTVKWRFLDHQTEAKSQPPPKRKHSKGSGKHSGQGKHSGNGQDHASDSGSHHHHHAQKQPHEHEHHQQWNPCPGSSAASQQYCEPDAAASSEPTGASEPSEGG